MARAELMVGSDMTGSIRIGLVLALLTTAGCATQYEIYREVSVRRMTMDEVFDRLDELDIRYHFETCDQVAAGPHRPLASCRHQGARGIVFALADNGAYLFGVGSAYVQLYLELDANDTVIEAREEPIGTLVDW